MDYTSIFFVFLFSVTTHGAKFPETWTKCPKTNNEECLKKAIEGALKDLKNGNKDLGVQRLDPLHFERMEMNRDSGPINMNLTFYDYDMTNVINYPVEKVTADWDNYKIEIDFGPIDQTVTGKYSMDAKVNLASVQGNGPYKFTYKDMKVKFIVTGSELVKNGKKYFNVDEIQYLMYPNPAHFWYGNLFNGNKELGDNVNKLLNDNWKPIMNELRASISKGSNQNLKKLVGNIFNKIPVDQLYSS